MLLSHTSQHLEPLQCTCLENLFSNTVDGSYLQTYRCDQINQILLRLSEDAQPA